MLRITLIYIIKCYQILISPYIGKVCKFEPSCSQYSIDALCHYGFIKGIYYSIKRIIRCNPYSDGGYDPVLKSNNKK